MRSCTRPAGLGLLLFLALAAAPAEADSGEAEWHSRPEKAMARAAADDRPVLAFFHATWCGWCRRMEQDVFSDAAVRQALGSFVLLSVDIDDQRAFALRYGVRGVPLVAILTPKGQTLAERGGYVPKEEFAAFLGDVLKRLGAAPDAAGRENEQLLAVLKKDDLAEADWRVIREALASGERRPLVMAGLLARRPFPAAELVGALEDPRLAVRLGTLEALEELNGDRCDYDPWADPAARAAGVAAWKAWAGRVAGSGKVERVQVALTAERVRKYLRDLVGADQERAARARFMLAGATRAAMPVIDEFAASGELDASRRLKVKEVRWAILTPAAWQARSLSFAHGLVYGTLDTRTELVRRLEGLGGSDALGLLKELLAEDEPLVREAAIKALRVGGGAEGLGVLLALDGERDPNVRTALLQNLGEAGSARALPLLLKSLSGSETETVTAIEALAKCLGNEAAAKRYGRSVSAAFRPLFSDRRWRVRAALAEAAGALKLEDLLSEVRGGLKDPDPFVRKLAVKALGRMSRKECVGELFELFKADHEFKPVVAEAFGSMSLAKLPEGFLEELLKAPPEIVVATVDKLDRSEAASQEIVRVLAANRDESIAVAALGSVRMNGRQGNMPDPAALGLAVARSAPDQPAAVRRAALKAMARAAGQRRYEQMRGSDGPQVDLEQISALIDCFKKSPDEAAPASPWRTLEKSLAGLLADADGEVRARAALGLAWLGRDAGLAELAGGDGWLVPPLDYEVADALGQVADRRALSLLARIGSKGSERARVQAIETLSSASMARTPGSVDALFDLLVSGAVSPGTFIGGLDSDLAEAAAGNRALGLSVARRLDRLSASGKPGVKRAALLLAGGFAGCPDVVSAFRERAAAMLESADPAERKTALVSLWRMDVGAGLAAAARRASDPVVDVRLVAARILSAAAVPDLADYVRDEYDGEAYRGSRSSRRGAAGSGRLDEPGRAALAQLYGDSSRPVRVVAGLGLLASGQNVDFSGLAADLSSRLADDWDWETRQAFEARRGPIPAAFYQYLSGLLSRSESYYRDDLKKLIARIPAAERERQRLMAQAAAHGPGRLAEEPAGPTVEPEPEPEQGPSSGARGPGRHAVAFFFEDGCRKCVRVRQELERLKAGSFPGLEIREYNLEQSGSKDLNEVLCRRAMVPDNLHLVGPAVFTARGALVTDDALDRARLIELIKAAEGLPAPWEEVLGEEVAAARQAIVSRVDRFTLPVVLGAGLLDGVNPCAFTTILFLLSYLTYLGRSRREILIAGVCFTVAVFAAYLAMGFGLLAALEGLAKLRWLNLAVGLAIGGLAVLLGAASVRDGVLCLKGRSAEMGLRLPDFIHRRIHQVIRAGGRFRNIAVAAAVMGLAISVLEFGCTGQVYLPTIKMVVGSEGGRGVRATGFLLAYNAMFILPLVGVFLLAFLGVSSERLTGLFKRHLAAVKFGTAALFLVLGWFVIRQFLAPYLP